MIGGDGGGRRFIGVKLVVSLIRLSIIRLLMASWLMIQLLRNLGRDIDGRIWSRVDRLGVLSSVDSIVCCALFFPTQICFAVGTDGARANIGGIR